MYRDLIDIDFLSSLDGVHRENNVSLLCLVSALGAVGDHPSFKSRMSRIPWSWHPSLLHKTPPFHTFLVPNKIMAGANSSAAVSVHEVRQSLRTLRRHTHGEPRLCTNSFCKKLFPTANFNASLASLIPCRERSASRQSRLSNILSGVLPHRSGSEKRRSADAPE